MTKRWSNIIGVIPPLTLEKFKEYVRFYEAEMCEAWKYDCEACASFRVACGDPQARCPEHPA